MELQEIQILRKHFIDVFEDNINEDVDYLCVRIFDVIQDLGGLNGLVKELILDTEWDFNSNHYLKDNYIKEWSKLHNSIIPWNKIRYIF
jgi:hypothetical protein